MEYREEKESLILWFWTAICLCLLLLSTPVAAQTRSFFFDIRSAAYKGLYLYEEGNYTAAIPLLEQAILSPKNRQFQPLQLALGHAYAVSGSAKLAAEWYAQLQESGFKLEGHHLLLYANALMASGKLEEGRQELMRFLYASGRDDQADIVRGQPLAEFFRDSVRYNVLPVSINTKVAEFSPLVLDHGVLFVSERPQARLVQKHFSADESNGLDVFYGRITNERDILQMNRLNEVVSSGMPEGPVAVTNNGKKLYFTRSGSKGMMQIFQAKSLFSVATWFDEKPLPLAVKGSVGHPAVDDDGQVLYFISDMPGGYGGTDIYKIEQTGNGWSQPRNLGPKVNTAGNEMFPTLSGKTKLYFASNGHFGLGGLDIYETNMIGDSIVNVRNMGVPVNSEGDDFSLSFHSSGTWAYFSSNRAGGEGKDDIYRLDLNLITLAGKVYEKINRKNLGNTRVVLYHDGVMLREAVTDKQGNYSFQLYPGQEYELQYSVEGFRDFKEVVSTRQGPRYGVKKWETGLDRKVKMFVLGTVKSSTKERVADASLLAVDQLSGRIDTVFADKRGNYEIELDAHSQYTFLASCNSEAVVSTFSTPERGKASLSYYVDFHLKPAANYKVLGMVNTPAGEKGPFVLSRLNKLSLEQDYIFTDEKGYFTFQVHALTEYELCLMNGKNSAPLLLLPGWKQKEREVFIGW